MRKSRTNCCAVVLVTLVILLAMAPMVDAQAGEPVQVIAIGHCTAILDVLHLSMIRQIDRQTGDGIYDVPIVAKPGTVVRINARWDDTLVLVYSDASLPVALRQLLCSGSPGWRNWLPGIQIGGQV